MSIDTKLSAPQSLANQKSLDDATLWRYMRQLVERLFGVLEGDDVFDDSLDILVDVLGADRGMVLVTGSDGTTRVVNARGQGKSLSTEERQEMSQTIIRRALDSGRSVTWDLLTATRASASISTLGILSAMAAPLYGPSSPRDQPRGVLYVDFRDKRKFVTERHSEFFVSASVLIGALLEQHGRGQVVREQLREAQSHCMESRRTPPLADLLTTSSMQSLKEEIESAIGGSSPILILGESGTGKTLLAQAIAEASGRRPIVRAVLGSSDDLNTITSELFGHEKGAFSGAASKRMGLAEFANGGTLILDEILNLPPHAQQLLLDFTQFGTYRPLGYDRAEPKRANVRIIAATNGDLRAAIRERRFREDLYYRLAALTIEVPPLRERRGDIPALAESTLRRVDPGRAWSLSVPLRRLLVSPALDWSGNVRQLERAIERARERAVARDPEATVLTPEHLEARDVDHALAAAATTPDAPAEALGVTWQRLQADRDKLDEREQSVLRQALAQSGGVVAQAARELGIARTTLSSRIDVLGIRVARRSDPAK
ncbi:MAG TPA: sigma 54-interacting transcriptional regulator [Polyangiaceae bacterium]|jgi:transcriptional regulator with GAF, ATPase, and Fis domain|nr:sigma 54-interacting transcriptional regulator [Polyangiaceae bacterium]